MMVFRYGFGDDIELGGAGGFLALTPKEAIVGVNLSTIILIVHGWLYVVYLACDFLLWRLMGWPFGRFLLIALGGIVPLLSFFFERSVPKRVAAEIATVEAGAAEVPA
jgi:integral membrane protein